MAQRAETMREGFSAMLIGYVAAVGWCGSSKRRRSSPPAALGLVTPRSRTKNGAPLALV